MLLDIIETNLNKIISPFSKRIGAFNFTPKEMEVIALIKEGKTSKQIAGLLNVSLDAISQHRYQIRRKLDLNRKKTGLAVLSLNTRIASGPQQTFDSKQILLFFCPLRHQYIMVFFILTSYFCHIT